MPKTRILKMVSLPMTRHHDNDINEHQYLSSRQQQHGHFHRVLDHERHPINHLHFYCHHHIDKIRRSHFLH